MNNNKVIYAESEILTAVLDGDMDLAQRMIGKLLPHERSALRQAASVIVQYTDPRAWCGGCGLYVDDSVLVEFFTRGKRWHHVCWLKAHNNHDLVE